ncbi:hypothetical protein GCM10009545_49650 [Saccharopolyspora thermophila]|uniref:Response regulatory domain-containing protein n=1 Tax=Saccharopolyspora thermophila TaxID=89367 RepID=A0ABP3NFY9_9PSEU
MAAVGLGQAARTTPAGALPANMVPHPREELFTVLVVDDHPLLREAIAARLLQMGAGTVHEAASMAEPGLAPWRPVRATSRSSISGSRTGPASNW